MKDEVVGNGEKEQYCKDIVRVVTTEREPMSNDDIARVAKNCRKLEQQAMITYPAVVAWR